MSIFRLSSGRYRQPCKCAPSIYMLYVSQVSNRTGGEDKEMAGLKRTSKKMRSISAVSIPRCRVPSMLYVAQRGGAWPSAILEIFSAHCDVDGAERAEVKITEGQMEHLSYGVAEGVGRRGPRACSTLHAREFAR